MSNDTATRTLCSMLIETLLDKVGRSGKMNDRSRCEGLKDKIDIIVTIIPFTLLLHLSKLYIIVL